MLLPCKNTAPGHRPLSGMSRLLTSGALPVLLSGGSLGSGLLQCQSANAPRQMHASYGCRESLLREACSSLLVCPGCATMQSGRRGSRLGPLLRVAQLCLLDLCCANSAAPRPFKAADVGRTCSAEMSKLYRGFLLTQYSPHIEPSAPPVQRC